jgi:hypothetical protein
MEEKQNGSSSLPVDPGPVERTSQTESLNASEPRLSVQQRWARGAQAGIDAARKMTHSQILAQARLNSGWTEEQKRRERKRKRKGPPSD